MSTDVVLSRLELERIRSRLARLQTEVDRLEAENQRMRTMARELTWCAHCGRLCDRVGRWRKFCSIECRRFAYNTLRRARYSAARDLGIPGRQAAGAWRTMEVAS